jgi:7-cyano-7-deazaguanine reductase
MQEFHSELGKKSEYDTQYNPAKLFPMSRATNREKISITSNPLPFQGFDVWNHYEVSWLNPKGKPMVAIAMIIYSCESENIIESKSLKLYFNSLNNTAFQDTKTLEALIQKDLEARLKTKDVTVHLTLLADFQDDKLLARLPGISIDELDIDCSVYNTDPSFLKTEEEWVEETLCSDLLKSNCLVTHQPDWCSVQIHYKGKKINREGLLRYIVSFRNDNEFHEHCIEKIFIHLMEKCQPSELTVYGRSNRRGGLDINSYRSTKPVEKDQIPKLRLCRQ